MFWTNRLMREIHLKRGCISLRIHEQHIVDVQFTVRDSCEAANLDNLAGEDIADIVASAAAKTKAGGTSLTLPGINATLHTFFSVLLRPTKQQYGKVELVIDQFAIRDIHVTDTVMLKKDPQHVRLAQTLYQGVR